MKKIYLLYFYLTESCIRQLVFSGLVFLHEEHAKQIRDSFSKQVKDRKFVVIRRELYMDKEYVDEILTTL